MTTINDIFRTYAPEYIRQYKDTMPHNHIKVINAIIHCRTQTCGATLYQCQRCGKVHLFFRSCGNRHCPTCQNHKTHMWVTRQMKRQLPGHHFLITFTLPQQLHPFIRSNQHISYNAMFTASSQAMITLAADPKYIGADLPGFFGILHTWGRQLHYHPHIHYIVPGGAISTEDHTWRPSHLHFFLPVKALSILFKAKFRDEMKRTGILDKISPEVWDIPWNVNSQAIGASAPCIKYLAPYVFRVAISNSRIAKIENHAVFFRYRKSHSNRWRTMALDVMEFIRRFLQHVLPKGFMKIRYYGFLNPTSSISLTTVASLIHLTFGFNLPPQEQILIKPPTPCTCPHCGGLLIYRASFFPPIPAVQDTG
jgi:Putative transposase/Transposase zinc-binding domain